MDNDTQSTPVFRLSESHAGDGSSILIVSLRDALPEVCKCLIYESEDVLFANERATLVSARSLPQRATRWRKLAAPVTRWSTRREWRNACSGAGLLNRRFSLLVVVCQSLADLAQLVAVDVLRGLAERSVCLIAEVWSQSLDWYRDGLQRLGRFDAAFVSCAKSVGVVQDALPMPVSYLAPAVDCLRFCPYPNPPERTIDVYWMGRRQEKTHRALLEESRRGRLFYLYDTVHLLHTPSVVEHRDLLASLIKRSRFFFVNSAKADMADQTAGQEEVGYRFFEGAAGGAALIGHAPDTSAFRDNFGWEDSMIHFDFARDSIGSVLEQVKADPARMDRIRTRNASEALRRHDWAYRWKQVLEAVGLAPSRAMTRRISDLHALADELCPRAEVSRSE